MAKKKRRVPTVSWDQPESTGVASTLTNRSPIVYLFTAIVAIVIVALGLVAYGLISDYVEDQRRPGSTALRIDDTDYELRYFTERLRSFVQQNGGAGSAAAQPNVAFGAVTDQLVEEAIMLRFAGEFGVAASEDEVDEEIAVRLGTTVESPDFVTRVQDELERTGISEDLFREQVEASILRIKVLDNFTSELPETIESIRFRQILVGSQAEADTIKAEIEDGADAAAIAEERSLDPVTSVDGGDVGWIPRGALVAQVEDTLFALDSGEVTVYPAGGSFFVYEILETDSARAIDDDQKPALAEVKLAEWVEEKTLELSVVDLVSTDVEKFNWAVEHAYGG
ncbi:MAG: SurA N-terminal domain-containing protein [Chloroflexi bacterium]|nr:SurA N-terminal domain-containing protein [Chloroflexota bacterium]